LGGFTLREVYFQGSGILRSKKTLYFSGSQKIFKGLGTFSRLLGPGGGLRGGSKGVLRGIKGV